MKLIEKVKNRYTILLIIAVLVFVVMVIKLADLTLVKGSELKDKADSMRVQQIPIRPARGEIRDKYGRLLAGNKPTFTVQIIKDQVSSKQRNETLLNLVRILEDEGEKYTNDFPIVLNTIDYEGPNLDNKDVYEELVDVILQNNLTDELLGKVSLLDATEGTYFYVAQRAVLYLEDKNKDLKNKKIPIVVSKNNDKVVIEFDKTKDYKKWKRENAIPSELSAKQCIIKLLTENKSKFKTLIKNPLVSDLLFELLMQKGLSSSYVFNEYEFTYDRDYHQIKRKLMKQFGNITMNTSAIEDFITIAMETDVMQEYVTSIIVDEEANEFIPAKLLYENLSKSNVEIPVIYQIENSKVIFKFKNEKIKNASIKKYDNEKISAIEVLLDFASKQSYTYKNDDKEEIKANCLEEFVKDPNNKFKLQKRILAKSVNPKISIGSWEYVPVISKNSWIKLYKVDKYDDMKDMFKALRVKFNIDKDVKSSSYSEKFANISDYEARCIMSIAMQLNKNVYRAYEPVNIAYDIKDSTCAKIMENNTEMPGVKISIDPTRFYPMKNTASHLIGYLGKISQKSELEEYNTQAGYLPDDIIGKTGIEEKFEKNFKGENGFKRMEVDVSGNTLRVLEEKKASPGDNVFLTIDSRLQKVAEDSLKQALEQIQIAGEYKSKWGNYNYKPEKDGRLLDDATSGAVVAIDVKTGEVLALANYPNYDPNLFVTGISNEDWESLKPENEEDPLAPRPLLNSALQMAVQPGSVFKMITGLAGLEKGLDPYKKINALGYVQLGNQKYGCWYYNTYRGSHGPTNLFDAIEKSCNYYFYTLAAGKNLRTNKKINVKVGIDDILNIAKQFGLNDRTGIEIDIPKEVNRGVPQALTKKEQTKRALKRYLDRYLDKFIKEGVKMTSSELDEKKKEIVSWIDLEEMPTGRQVYAMLTKLGFDAGKKLPGKVDSLNDIVKYTYLNAAQWKLPDTFNITIGQGQNAYTPIQIANYIATLANGGYRYDVSVVDKIVDINGNEKMNNDERVPKKVQVKNDEYLNYVKKGMYMAATDGTAKSIFRNFPIKVGVKTGTAEKDGINPVTKEKYDDYSWFVAFAPYDDPQIAIATVITQGGHGGFTGPIAKDIIAEYLGLNNKENKISLKNRLAQ